MPYSPDSSITGATITGLTSPTYTLVSDGSDANSRQHAVSALGGTQTGVRAHSAGDPFTATIRRERYKALPPANPVTGARGNVPLNRIELLVRKGMYIDTANSVRVGNIRVIAELPAGAELSDAVNIKALVSFVIGLLVEEADDYANTLTTGLIT